MSGMKNDGRACRTCCVVCVARYRPLLFNSNGLSFFKVMTSDSTSFLEIPWTFVGGMLDGLWEDALLIGLNGCVWPIKLSITNDLANFRKGWGKFVSDNCLNDGDIVVFRHVTRYDFIVQIFSANGYEKQCAKEEIPPEVCNHGEKLCACLKIIHIEKENSEDTELELACNPAVENLAEPDLALEMRPGVSRLRPSCTEKKSKLKVRKAQNTSCVRRKNKLKKVQETQNALTRTKNKSSSKRYAAEVLKLIKTKNPKFVKLMTESSVTDGCRFSFPKNFAKQWLQNQDDIVLNSPKLSNLWVVKIFSYSRFFGIASGWRDFVLAHNLKENDACVFELVDKKRSIFKVHVVK